MRDSFTLNSMQILNSKIKSRFIELMNLNNIQWHHFYRNIDMFDDLLSEATKWAYRNIRTPGRYKYDKSKGEEDIEDYNK
jgi:hypothetical protein